jgi:hypothetical protein
MKRGWIGVLAVAAVAAAIITYKEEATSSRLQGPAGSPRPTAATPSILLVADLSEAGTDDSCAEIIRLVRAAGERGVPIREIPSSQDAPVLRQYRITVEPTVLLLDANGRVLARHEGEGRQTIAALRSDLERLTRQR